MKGRDRIYRNLHKVVSKQFFFLVAYVVQGFTSFGFEMSVSAANHREGPWAEKIPSDPCGLYILIQVVQKYLKYDHCEALLKTKV